MKAIPYSSAVGSLMYDMLHTRLDICYAVSMVNKYESNPGLEYWTAVKYIFKYLRRTRDYMLTYGGSDLILVSYINSNFMSDMNFRQSTSRYVFTFGGETVSWRSIKQQSTAYSTTEVKYVAATEAGLKSSLQLVSKSRHINPSMSMIIIFLLLFSYYS